MKTPRNYALWLLGKREHSVVEVREKLVKKFPEKLGEIEDLITEFIEKDWIADQRYIDIVIRDQIIRRQGPRKIEQKLMQKGIECTLARKRLSVIYSPEEELEIVKYLYEKKEAEVLRKNPKLSDFEKQGKVSQFLVGRGFGYDVINSVAGK